MKVVGTLSGPDPPITDVIGRAVTLLELVASSPLPTRLAVLVRHSGLPKTTVYRTLQSLVAHDLVVRGPSGYAVGARTQELAALVVGHGYADLRRFLMPFLVELYNQTSDVVRLAVLHGDQTIFLETLCPPRHTAAMADVADTGPSLGTASGNLLIALRPDWLDPTRLEELSAATSHPIAADRLVREFLGIRRNGIARADDEVPGMVAVAVPILGIDATPIAALEVACTRGEFDPTHTGRLRRTAVAASVALRRRRSPLARQRPPWSYQ